jgi:hypothetical protein
MERRVINNKLDRVWKEVVSLNLGTILNIQKNERIQVRIYESTWASIF